MTNNDFHPFDETGLSPEDLAVLKAFDEMMWEEASPSDEPQVETPPPQPPPPVSRVAPEEDADFLQEMQHLFVGEASEDLEKMRKVWSQLELAASLSPEQFIPLRRGGHKIRGSAGAVNYASMATIAGYIEDIADQVVQSQLLPDTALRALAPILSALEETLQSIIVGGEDDAPLARLTPPLKVLTYDALPGVPTAASPVAEPRTPLPEPALSSLLFSEPELELGMAFLRVEPSRAEELLIHSQQLTELRTSLENSQTQVTQALQELHRSQARLRQLQPMLSTLSTPVSRSPQLDEQSSSSLVARILAQAEQHGDHEHLRKLKAPVRGLPGTNGVALWDELDMEQYSEQDLFLRSLSEAIADVSLSSARVQTACEQRELVLQNYLNQAALVHNSVLQIRLVPLRLLLPELRQFIQLFSTQQNQPLEFDVQGEMVEVDQAVLDTLARPLLQLFQVCLADATVSLESAEVSQPARIWLHAQQVGNEVSLEIGFSMPVSGGALEGMREPLQRVNGTFFLGRNSSNGVSFYFRFPRAQGAAHCLLIRVGNERFAVPAAQVQRISDCQYETLNMVYDLAPLLGLPSTNDADQRIQPVLILPTANSPVLIGVKVDEVIDDMELAMKPLPSYLQRPGIVCSSIDGKGNVLLLLDLPELIRHHSLYGQKVPMLVREYVAQPQRPGAATVLIADDSVSMRQSLRQMLTWAQYTVLEARDGMVALEQLLEHMPDVLLLDIEMPNLNGYDLLRAMRAYPQLAHVKTVVLTSRSSDKHKGQARALGAHLYLTKPVVSEVLLSTIKELLAAS